MSTKNIGENIAELRREKSVTQEELARAVGVTSQAVSKWECGGLPDTELIPAIADFFAVPTDRLFGRGIGEYGDMKTEFCKYMISLPAEERLKTALEFCFCINTSFFNVVYDDAQIEHDNFTSEHNGYWTWADERMRSQILDESGFSLVSLSEALPYYFLLPKPENGWLAGLPDKEELLELFGFFADPEKLDTMIVLHSRPKKPFTREYFANITGMSPEKVSDTLEVLKKRWYIEETEVDLNDAVQTQYQFEPNPAFVAFLVFAKELLHRPGVFGYTYMGNMKYF